MTGRRGIDDRLGAVPYETVTVAEGGVVGMFPVRQHCDYTPSWPGLGVVERVRERRPGVRVDHE